MRQFHPQIIKREQAIRMSVIFRRVTNGFRSEWGRDLFAAVRSVVNTGKRQGLTAYQSIQQALSLDGSLFSPSWAITIVQLSLLPKRSAIIGKMIIQEKWKNTLFLTLQSIGLWTFEAWGLAIYRQSQATNFQGLQVGWWSLPAATISLGRADLFLSIFQIIIASWRHYADLNFSNVLKIQWVKH